MILRGGRQDVRRHAAALFVAQLRVCGTRPAAHQAEGMAHTDQRRVWMLDDRIEQTEQRRLPRIGLANPLRELADAVIEAWVEIPRTTGADVEREPAARRIRQSVPAPHVE